MPAAAVRQEDHPARGRGTTIVLAVASALLYAIKVSQNEVPEALGLANAPFGTYYAALLSGAAAAMTLFTLSPYFCGGLSFPLLSLRLFARWSGGLSAG